MTEQFYAKSVLPNGKQPTVKEHLSDVSELAALYGTEIKMRGAAQLAGQIHDFGKYSMLFQRHLKKEIFRINHAICGAVLLDHQVGKYSGFHKIIEAVSAHHSALRNYAELHPSLRAIWNSPEEMEFDGKTAALTGQAAYQEAFAAFCADFPDYRPTKSDMLLFHPGEKEMFVYSLKSMLMTRMLFSCLVDADYSASAAEEDDTYLECSEGPKGNYSAAIHDLEEYRAGIRSKSTAQAQLDVLRGAVFDACTSAAEQEPGCFNLTAPTGTGKTLALLQFALCHCGKWNKSRIIIVLPFLSLTEQSAAIYRNIIPDLLEDTSQSTLSDEARLYSSRWRVPVIVTTSVKFFESLFADRPTDCRRLHNIANSVILFDEAQTLPPELIRATIHASRELTQRYGCTMVFSTATQPDFSAIPTLECWTPKEILQDYRDFYAVLKRTKVTWRIEDSARIGWDELAREMSKERSVCTIVNLRRHARTLYQQLCSMCGKEGVFFLTTDLCPAHRSQVISDIRARLDAQLPCRVVSTQCIEAGVDLDFNTVYRALAPLEGIIQAAGRCNRNGRMPDLGQVVVFRPVDEGYPGNWYRNAAETVRRLCMDHPLDIHDPSEIQRYYRQVYSKLQDKPELKKSVEEQDYQGVAKAYRMIENNGFQVIVPFKGQLELYHRIREEAIKGITPAIMRQAAPITVSTYAKDALDRVAEHLPFRKYEDGMSPYFILSPDRETCYTSDLGLQIPDAPDPVFLC